MLNEEEKAYVKNLEGLLKARTEQLREALKEIGKLRAALTKEKETGVGDEILDRFSEISGKPGDPVPEVDPEDVRAVWRGCRELERAHPGEQIATTAAVFEPLCTPGADMRAVWYRNSQLGLLRLMAEHKHVPSESHQQFSEFQAKITALMNDGEFNDAAFRAMEKVPMEWMEAGVVRNSPPYDFEEFLRLCAI
jgi:hypothetical protein